MERSCQGWELRPRVALDQWEILVATWVEVETPWGRSEPKGEEQAELTSERTSCKGTKSFLLPWPRLEHLSLKLMCRCTSAEDDGMGVATGFVGV